MHKKLRFGLAQVNRATPRWAKNALNIITALAALAHIWIASTALVKDIYKVEIMLAIVLVQTFLHFLAKLMGVEIQEIKDTYKTKTYAHRKAQ